jgi:hypothetical protein
MPARFAWRAFFIPDTHHLTAPRLLQLGSPPTRRVHTKTFFCNICILGRNSVDSASLQMIPLPPQKLFNKFLEIVDLRRFSLDHAYGPVRS